MITTVDSHTAGEPTRIVIGGFPRVPGKNMNEKRIYLQKELDFLRTLLMHEPRGHNDMFGAVLMEPEVSGADLGVVFMDGGGYLPMCGHGVIGVATVALEMGLVEAKEPVTTVALDTPAGIVYTRVNVEDLKVKSVTMKGLPSFFYTSSAIRVSNVGEVPVEISFGGNFFAIVNAKDIGIEIKSENVTELIQIGMKIRNAANLIPVEHPEIPYINKVELVEICGESTNPMADSRSIVVFGDGQVDRSPCGTGTCAKMATLYARGNLKLNEDFVHESVLGTLFIGRLIEETAVGDFKAVVPEVTGSAYITGIQQFIVDPSDPLKYGFCLG